MQTSTKPRRRCSTYSFFGAMLLIIAGACLQGCNSSPWRQNFVATGSAAALSKEAPVQLREVSWDRLQAGLKKMKAAESKSDVSPADWSPEQKQQAKAELLRILQVSEPPQSVEILGRADFRTTSQVDPEKNQADIIQQARNVGANRVVWSRRLMGKADEIIQEPVTTYGTNWGWGRRHGPYTETYTTWVPIRVQADEYAYVAYFLKV